MEVRWTSEAEQDRGDIWDHISGSDPRAAARMDRRFSAAGGRLARHPLLGKPGRIPGTRELLPYRTYRLVYEIEDEIIWILALVHTSRQWPPLHG